MLLKQTFNLGNGALNVLVLQTRRPAPGVGARSASGKCSPRLSELVDLPRVSGLLPLPLHCGYQGVDLVVVQKVLEGHHPGISGQHLDIIPLTIHHLNGREHVVHVSRGVDRISGYIEKIAITSQFRIA